MARRPIVVGVALVVATAVAVLVSASSQGWGVRVGAAVTVVLGAGKAVAIGLEFMELRRAPSWLWRLFLGWASVLTVLCLVLVVG